MKRPYQKQQVCGLQPHGGRRREIYRCIALLLSIILMFACTGDALSQDCNSNGIADTCDLACGDTGGPCDIPGCGGSADCNANGVPDECELATGLPDLENAWRSPINGHLYLLTEPMSWTSAEAAAVALGGHLATIRSEAENQWLLDTFAPMTTATGGHIGFTDAAVEGQWVWLNGDPVTYTHWAAGEPNNTFNSDNALFLFRRAGSAYLPGDWLDIQDSMLQPGIVEIPDIVDCNHNGVLDECDIADGTSTDCNGNAIPDDCDTDPTDPDEDGQISDDCNANGIPDDCDVDPADLDGNGQVSDDCNANGVPDECELVTGLPDLEGAVRSPINKHLYLLTEPMYWTSAEVEAVALGGHLVTIRSEEENQWLLDTFIPMTDALGVHIGFTDAAADGQWAWLSSDPVTYTHWAAGEPNGSAVAMLMFRQSGSYMPGEWIDVPNSLFRPGIVEIRRDVDCNDNLVLDECDIADGTSTDCNENAIPDECEVGGTEDCDSNGISDLCDLASGTHEDCDENGIPDVCQLATDDCNANGTPDQCEADMRDCNVNGIPDECDIDPADPDGNDEVSEDCNTNGEPDECELILPSAALDFDGVDDIVRIPRSATLEPAGELTVEAWIFPRSAGSYHSRILRYAADFQPGYALAWQASGNRRLRFTVTATNADVHATDDVLTSTYFGSWHHVAGVYSQSGGYSRLYVDGVLKVEEPSAGTIRYSNTDMGIGNFWAASNEDFDGLVDEVRIWTVARTQSQLIETMNRSLIGTETGLAGFWSFDEGQGQAVFDASINANHGFLGGDNSPSGDGLDPTWVVPGRPVPVSDCNDNGVLDECDIADQTSADCNENDIPDECEIGGTTDCDSNGVMDLCDLYLGTHDDCDEDGVPDVCQPVYSDCNANGISDHCELEGNDCNMNGIPDECDLDPTDPDGNGEISDDCNTSGIPDECELTTALPGMEDAILCPLNGHFYKLTDPVGWPSAEAEAIALGGHLATIRSEEENLWLLDTFAPLTSAVAGHIGFTDAASEGTWVWVSGEPVTYTNWGPGEPNDIGTEDNAELVFQPVNSLLPGDWVDISTSVIRPGIVEIPFDNDCNVNGILDECELADGTSTDCNENDVLDDCEVGGTEDCDSNGIMDLCDLYAGTYGDCDEDGVPDVCQLVDNDCDTNGIPDNCEMLDFALDFDGRNDYVVVPRSSVFEPTDELTIEVWIYAHSSGEDHSRIVRNASPSGYILAFQQQNDRRAQLRIDGAESGSIAVKDTVSTDDYLNGWHHIAGVYSASGNYARLYVDGDLKNEMPAVGTLQYAGGDLRFGNWSTSSEDFEGLIDEVRIWSVARTQNQIRNHMFAPLSGEEAGLVGYWAFNDGVGQFVTDSSPYGNHGRRGDDDDPHGDAADPFWVDSDSPVLKGDCNENGVFDECDIADATSTDCNGNGVPDECELGGTEDCDSNGVMDLCDLYAGTYEDCDDDRVPDVCQLLDNDCNTNGIPDNCELDGNDCNTNGIPDECDVDPADPDGDGLASDDCNTNGVPDECEFTGASLDVLEQAILNPTNGHYYMLTPTSTTWAANEAYAVSLGGHLVTIRSEAENQWLVDTFRPLTTESEAHIGFTDQAVEGTWVWASGEPVGFTKWGSGQPDNSGNEDYADLIFATAVWNDNYRTSIGIVEFTITTDCNENGVLDECDIADETSADCNENGIPDECEIGGTTDCDSNGILDLCDLHAGTHEDCDGDGVPDVCQLVDNDCNTNGIPDHCELDGNDCNSNGIPDECDVDPTDPDGDGEVSDDCNTNGVPDECEFTGASLDVLEQAILNPTNGHYYMLTPTSTSWTADEAHAVSLGGHLATIRSAAENQWLVDTFDPLTTATRAYIGFTDQAVEGEWVWVSGEPVTYTNWASGEPNDYGGNEDYAFLRFASRDWNDYNINGYGIIEFAVTNDCNDNGVLDECEIADGTSGDCNSNGMPDECEVGGTEDCDTNGVMDLCDLYAGTHEDCDEDGVPDVCQLIDNDCNSNGIPDNCELEGNDCNTNGVLDDCDVDPLDPDGDGEVSDDCNTNGTPDRCEIMTVPEGAIRSPISGRLYLLTDPMSWASAEAEAVSLGGHLATIRSEEENQWLVDTFAPLSGDYAGHIGFTDAASEGNWVWVSGEPITYTNWGPGEPNGAGNEVNANLRFYPGAVLMPGDWNDVPLSLIRSGIVELPMDTDCNENDILDECEIAAGTSTDCNENSLLDECEIGGTEDCDENGVTDLCDLHVGTHTDCNHNGVLDVCDLDPADPDGDGWVPDDCNGNGLPDECDGSLINRALLFDGDDDCVVLPPDLVSTRSVVTFEAWFSTFTGGVIFGYQDAPYPATPTNYTPAVYVGRDGRLHAEFNMGSPASALSSVYEVNDGDWHHVALSANTNTQTLYLDGVALGTLVGEISHPDQGYNQVGMGHGHLNAWPGLTRGWHSFDGLIDDVRLWGVARTRAQIVDYMYLLPNMNDPNLLGRWRFNAGWGQVAADASSAGNDGTLGLGSVADYSDPVWTTADAPEMSDDCNNNGILDECDIAEGGTADCNANGVPDECELDCNGNGIPNDCDLCGDIDGDGDVDYADYVIFRSAFGGATDGIPALDDCCDYDRSGVVGMTDYGVWLNCYRDFIGDPLAGPPIAPTTPHLGPNGLGGVQKVEPTSTGQAAEKPLASPPKSSR